VPPAHDRNPSLLDAPPRDDDPQPLRAARGFLDGTVAAPELAGKLDDGLAAALVDALVARGDAGKLEALAGLRDKPLAKRARRGIHLLRTRGVKAEVPRRQEDPEWIASRAEPAAEESLSLVSFPVRDGDTIVWYVAPITTGEAQGLDVFQIEESEQDGMVRFERYRPTRRQWRDVIRQITTDTELFVTRVPAEYARWRLEDAWQRATAAGKVPPRGYAESRHEMAPAVAPARPLAEDAVPASAVDEAVREAGSSEEVARRVLALPELRTWIPEEQAARGVFLEFDAVATSPLLLDERQRGERLEGVLRRFRGEALRGPWRARLARRLEETAWLLARVAAQRPTEVALRPGAAPTAPRDYLREAALCIAVAREVRDEAADPEQNAFVRLLFDRLLPPAPEAPPEREPGSLIVPP